MDDQPTISTHVLDTEHGWPARGVKVSLYKVAAGGERLAGEATTDDDGRIARLLAGELEQADYRIEFAVDGAFFASGSFTFHVRDTTRSYHVPLLIAPYSVSTYRGS
jgi:5-hydroxyisourate hydrolase